MNVVKIYGGLGNQLFQYAFGQAMVQYGTKVCYDVSWFGKRACTRQYLLDKFNTNVKIGCMNKNQGTVREQGFELDCVLKKGFNFFGYWQSPLWHTDILEILKQEIHVKSTYFTSEFLKLRSEILHGNSVALHVRRGDYLADDRHQVTGADYYTKALRIIRALQPDCTVYVFSDDMDWCMSVFTDVIFVHLDDCLDFELMRLCRHHIISNSTYSWWAAYLKNSDGIVLTPVIWDKDEKNQKLRVVTRHLLLDNWIKL